MTTAATQIDQNTFEGLTCDWRSEDEGRDAKKSKALLPKDLLFYVP